MKIQIDNYGKTIVDPIIIEPEFSIHTLEKSINGTDVTIEFPTEIYSLLQDLNCSDFSNLYCSFFNDVLYLTNPSRNNNNLILIQNKNSEVKKIIDSIIKNKVVIMLISKNVSTLTLEVIDVNV